MNNNTLFFILIGIICVSLWFYEFLKPATGIQETIPLEEEQSPVKKRRK